MNINRYDITYQKSILSWDEALPLGNGKMGCLIYGDGPIRFSLDRGDLWDLRPNPVTQEEGFTFKNLLRLVKSEKAEDWAEYTRLFDDVFTSQAYPSKITAGRMELDFGLKTEDIYSRVDIHRAIANVEGENLRIESFLSATRFVGIARVRGEYRLDIHIPSYLSNVSGEETLAYPQAEIVRDGEYVYYEQTTHTEFRFGIVALKKDCGEYSELYFTIATNGGKQDGDFIARAKEELKQAAEIGYDVLKTEHVKWWKKYWTKSSITIGDKLLEKTYYRSWYLFASCSRKGFYPMPLQGVWTADNDKLPPWRGDYHHDTNTELSYQAYLKANRMDEGKVFVEYLWSLKSEFERFAKEFFGVNGLLLPSCSTLDGKAMGGWAQYSLSPTMTIWAAQSFDEYYLYTGDENFLKTRAYPFFKEVGEAFLGLLKEKNGKLYLPLSSSPEIYDNTPKAYLKPNSNFDQALLIYLYKTLLGYAEKLGKDRGRYEVILSKLDSIAVDEEGVVLLDKTQRLPESHRHFSHLMCMYPLHLLNYDKEDDKRIYKNTLLHLEQLGSGWWAGFSFAMSAQIYAMAQMGNAAYEKLRAFALGFVADNGFHLNGDFKNHGFSQWHYRPFTLESLFGYCDALQETLLQEHQGYIHLFPALSQSCEGKRISFNKLRSYGGVRISAERVRGKITKLSFLSDRPQTICLKNTLGLDVLHLLHGKTEASIKEENGYFQISLKKGKTKVLTL